MLDFRKQFDFRICSCLCNNSDFLIIPDFRNISDLKVNSVFRTSDFRKMTDFRNVPDFRKLSDLLKKESYKALTPLAPDSNIRQCGGLSKSPEKSQGTP